jgi:hypothetical protein
VARKASSSSPGRVQLYWQQFCTGGPLKVQPVATLVATPSPKKQIMSKNFWQFVSEEQGTFHQNFELVSSFCNFSPKNNDCLLGLD